MTRDDGRAAALMTAAILLAAASPALAQVPADPGDFRATLKTQPFSPFLDSGALAHGAGWLPYLPPYDGIPDNFRLADPLTLPGIALPQADNVTNDLADAINSGLSPSDHPRTPPLPHETAPPAPVPAPVEPADDGANNPPDTGSHVPGRPFNLDNLPVSRIDRVAIGRVAFAEAGNQGDDGIAAVVFAVLNRAESGQFGPNVQAVINAPGQFEPVTKAGGDWRNLPALTPEQQIKFNTIFNLIFDGMMPDPTHGATFFQNPAIVADREARGAVSAGLTNFGGLQPIAVIRDHSFYYRDQGVRIGVLPTPQSFAAQLPDPEASGLFTGNTPAHANPSQTQEQALFLPVAEPDIVQERARRAEGRSPESSGTDLKKPEDKAPRTDGAPRENKPSEPTSQLDTQMLFVPVEAK